MSPLERYEAGKNHEREAVRTEQHRPLKNESKNIQEWLKGIKREGMRRAIEQGKRRAEERNALKKAENQPKTRENYRDIKDRRKTDRQKNYLQLSESGEQKLAEAAYKELLDFKSNRENYGSEGGWQEQYLLDADQDGIPYKEKMSLEEFVSIRQAEQLEEIRESLIVYRVGRTIESIYPELAGDEKSEERNKQIEQKSESAKQFFRSNDQQIQKYLNEETSDEEKQKIRTQLAESFQSGVFADLNGTVNQEALQQVNSLFIDLLNDYEQKIIAGQSLAQINQKTDLVAMMGNENMTEDQWNKALEKAAEAAAKDLEEQQKQQVLIDQTLVSGSSVSHDFESAFNGNITTGEQLGTTSRISIQAVNPEQGIYKVKFPEETGGGQETEFQVRQVAGEGGRMRNVFIFNDSLLPAREMVGDERFKGEVNKMYLRHVSSEGVREGRDYLGTDLNAVINPQEMYEMAGSLFYPENPDKLNQSPLSIEQANIFKKLVLIMVSSSNNEKGSGDYGNLLSIRNRVDLLKFVLTNKSQAESCFRYLQTLVNPEDIKKLSVETLCRSINVPRNLGNYK